MSLILQKHLEQEKAVSATTATTIAAATTATATATGSSGDSAAEPGPSFQTPPRTTEAPAATLSLGGAAASRPPLEPLINPLHLQQVSSLNILSIDEVSSY